ncbi:2TM domain-containing protein [Dokdonia sp. Hel_I_53]|uniref:2TM domain-containing protein n=1 Tax=Dokdonia sp. Hel_I_53 TaxID=1566287 RepID=UPI00119C0F7C|nr:2TM domain-containing protein [Dokdonia sp. Hel_I_53]TVZ52971.1 2TM domain-containing protein [Dokdonia sp. Hel_I_53]
MSLFSKKTNTSSIDPEQRELIENAQARIKQKKKLYRHFVLFLAGAIVLIVLNLALGIGKEFKILNIDWFVWAILLWSFFFLVHIINVVFMSSFMNKEWEKEQLDKLVTKQKLKIAELDEAIQQKMPLPEKKKPSLKDPNLPLTDQNTPL